MSSPINGSIQDVILELMISNESLTKIDDDLVSIYDALWDFVKGKDGWKCRFSATLGFRVRLAVKVGGTSRLQYGLHLQGYYI